MDTGYWAFETYRGLTMPPQSKIRWHGALEGMEDGLAFGWCIDTLRPDSRVVIELCVNGDGWTSVIADVARADLAKRFERTAGNGVDVCHGFVADLRVHTRALPGALTARVANTLRVLPGRVTHRPRSTALSVSVGNFVFGDGGLRLHGSCKQLAPRAGPAIVRAFVDEREVARATAGQRHPAVRSFGAEADGFVLDLPPELADGVPRLVRIVDDNGAALDGSPVTVCCYLSGARALLPRGRHEALAAVLDAHEHHLPRSLGHAFYPAWRREFEDSCTFPASQLRAGLVITNASDAAAVKRTKASIAAQRSAKTIVFPDIRTALESNCDVLGFVRAGDELSSHAIAAALEGFVHDSAAAVYTDSEFEGRPWFKPAWNLDYALATDCPLELLLVRRAFARANRPARPATASAALHAWTWLAAAAQQGPDAIVHVPRALYIWSTAPTDDERRERTAAAQVALAVIDPRSRLKPIAAAEPLFRARRIVAPVARSGRRPAVSLIIPTRDRADLLERCIDSIHRHTTWPDLEVIVVDNDSVEPQTHKLLRAAKTRGVRVLKHPGSFNFSAMNNRAVKAARGPVVGLINNDIEAIEDGWLDEIVGQLLRPGIGAVGAKLLWPNGMVQHGGVLLGVGNAAGHFGNRLADTDWGDHGRNALTQQVSGVTAACLFVRKKDYLLLGGMDEQAFPVTFNDVDLCLKLRARGLTIVWTPFARLLHAESASRGREEAPAQRARAQRELDALRARWGSALLRDPAYHPSLNLDAHSHAFGGLAIPPRDRRPRTGALPA